MIRSVRLPAASVFAVVLALLIAACSSSATATPTPTPQPTESTGGLGGSGGLGGLLGGLSGSGGLGGSGGLSALLGALHGDPTLEAKLPAQLCGAAPITMSAPSGAIPVAALGALGGGVSSLLSGMPSTATVSYAVGIADPTAGATCTASIYAFEVSGGDPTTLMNEYVQAQVSSGATSSQASLGGKNVTVLVSDGNTTYSYVSRDTIFGVQAADDTTAGTILAQLP